MKWRGGGCLLHYTDISGAVYILVGHETRYLMDYIDQSIIAQRDLCAYQDVPLGVPEIDAHQIFSQRAKELSLLQLFTEGLTNTITYDSPAPSVDSWTVNFRVLPRPPNQILLGIPKGGMKASDRTPQETACREIQEEIGVAVDPQRLAVICLDRSYHFFSCALDASDVGRINAAIEQQRAMNFGELQDVQFVEIGEAARRFGEFNGMTRKVLREFLRLHHPDILERHDLEPV